MAVSGAITPEQVTSLAQKVSGGGFATVTFGWITSSSGIAAIGLFITVLGFTVNYIYQRKRDQREREIVALRAELELRDDRRKEELHNMHMRVLKEQLGQQTESE